MALADTAKLVASLELQDKFTGPARKAESSLGSLDKKMSTLGQGAKTFGHNLGSIVTNLAKVGVGVAAGGIALLTVNIKAGVEALAELDTVITATETVIASTGGVAGQSADDIRQLAEEYENLNAQVDDKVIQAAANRLLQFTSIGEEAFEPALAAALDLNEAVGGGSDGLQANIVKVGKLLNDPITNINSLSKAGVQFTKQEKEQIKALQEAGDLYGAQQIVLERLAQTTGGRFAAAGQTAQGRMAKLADSVEDLQKRLAGPLLPAIDRVREKLIELLSGENAGAAAEKIGTAIAGIFTQPNIDAGAAKITALLDKINGLDTAKLEEGGGLLANVSDTLAGLKSDGTLADIGSSIKGIASEVARLPWQAIGDAAKLLGTGSKALLDAFLGLPSWVQTAVLTGWGLNKLTGGALTGIVGALTSGLIKGILGINAGVVNLTAGTVTGPGGGVPGGGGGLGLLGGTALITASLATIAGGISTIQTILGGTPEERTNAGITAIGGFPALIGVAVSDALIAAGIIGDPSKPQPVTDESAGQSLADVDAGIAAVDRKLADANTSNVTNRQAVIAALTTQRSELQRTRAAIVEKQQSVLTATLHEVDTVRRGFNDNGGKIARLNSGVASVRDSVQTSNSHLAVIRNKRTSITVNNTVNVTATLAASQLVAQATAYSKTTSGGALAE